jgi:hypothetical protein
MNRGEAKKFQLRGGVLVLILGVLAILSADAFSGPVVKRTTSEQWSFSESEPNFGPVLPDAGLDNYFGDPCLWVGDRAEFDKGNGAWTLLTDEIDIFIPNYQDSSAGSMKEMTVELTWQGANRCRLPDKPSVVVTPEGQYDKEIIEPGADIQIDGWKKTVFTISIWPNPSSEWVMIKGDIILDKVVINTECIPEPATLALVIGGAFLAIRRKRNG